MASVLSSARARLAEWETMPDAVKERQCMNRFKDCVTWGESLESLERERERARAQALPRKPNRKMYAGGRPNAKDRPRADKAARGLAYIPAKYIEMYQAWP